MSAKGGKSRRCLAVREWSLKVRERDGNVCQNCRGSEKLQAHHIVPWYKDENKRLDINNGITYCSSCHTSIEKAGRKPWITGKKHTMKARLKMRKAKIGYTPWNKGKTSENPENRICRICNIEKKITDFTPQGKWYTKMCKLCRNAMLKRERNGHK